MWYLMMQFFLSSFCRRFFYVVFAVGLLALPCAGYAQGTPITVVSDTTDVCEDSDEVYDSGNVVPVDSAFSMFNGFYDNDGGFWNVLKTVFLDGGFFMLPVIILLCIFLLPLLLIILLVFFLLKDRKRKRMTNIPPVTPCANAYDRYMELEKKKDSLVMNIAVGVAVTVFFVVYGWRFCAVLSVAYICVKAGTLYNVIRKQKRQD